MKEQASRTGAGGDAGERGMGRGTLIPLGHLCAAIVDCEHKTAPTEPAGIPLVRTTNIKNGRIDFESCNRVSKETYILWTQRMTPEPSDLILAREAPVGEVGIIPSGMRACLGQRTVLIRPNPEFLEPRYILYLLLTSEMRHEMACRAEGSTVPHLNMSDIRALEIPEPPSRDTQRAIASILGALDDKIELNRQMNAILEQIGQAIFKHWFVDFEFPNGDGKPYRSSGGEMVDSELGEVPEEWVVGALGDICEITMGQSPPSKTYNEIGAGTPFYLGNCDFGFRFPTRRVYCTAPTRFAEEGGVLLSVCAPVGNLNVTEERCAIGRGVAALRLKGKQHRYLHYLLRDTRSVWNEFEAEGAVFGSANKSDVQGFKVVIPPNKLQEQLYSAIKPLNSRIINNEKQSRALATIHDALLPKFMSEEVRISMIKNMEIQ